MQSRHLIAATVFAFVALAAPRARAEEFPSRPISIVVPLTPGTTIDILARLYGDRLQQLLGEPVVVVNKPGAGGVIGAEVVANAKPDGYTLIFANSGHSILGLLNKDLPFDPIKDFAGVAMVGIAPAIVVVSPQLGVADLKDFIALAKSKPGELNYGSAGIGTSTHLAGAYFAALTRLNMVHIPYRVSANIISDLLSGSIQASFDPLAFVLSQLQAGRLRALAVGADHPVTDPIRISTAVSQGVDYRYATWYGIMAPAKTPVPVMKALAAAIGKAGEDAELRQKIAQQGIEPQVRMLADFDDYVAADVKRLAPLTVGLNAKP